MLEPELAWERLLPSLTPLAPPENARLLYAYSVLQLIRKVGVAEPAAAPGVIKIKLRSES